MTKPNIDVTPFQPWRSDAWVALCRGQEFRIVHGQTIIDDGPHNFYHQGVSWLRLALFDMDYEVAVHAQVWQHDDPDRHWRYVLLYADRHGVNLIHEWPEHPTYTEVATRLDAHLSERFNQ